MRVTLLLFFASSVYTTVAQLQALIGTENTYPRYIYFPDGDINYHNVDLEAQPNYAALNEIKRNPVTTQYILFTKKNPKFGHNLVINNTNSIRKSHYNKRIPTVVIAHGWHGNKNTNINHAIRDAYLDTRNVNVIILDWGTVARLDYVTAVCGVPAIGRGLGQFINFLVKTTGAKLKDIHLIGFSLGAHVVGNAGKELQGKVARITGLDPAGPLWSFNRNCISRTDAIYVEAIHTNAGMFGISSAVADVDFFANGGTSQPGCDILGSSHNRAWELFTSTVIHNHLIGNKCNDYLQIIMNKCRGSQLQLGNADLKKTGSGIYRVNTGNISHT